MRVGSDLRPSVRRGAGYRIDRVRTPVTADRRTPRVQNGVKIRLRRHSQFRRIGPTPLCATRRRIASAPPRSLRSRVAVIVWPALDTNPRLAVRIRTHCAVGSRVHYSHLATHVGDRVGRQQDEGGYNRNQHILRVLSNVAGVRSPTAWKSTQRWLRGLLFATQRRQRVHARGPSCRDVTRSQRHREHDRRHRREGLRVGRACAEQERRQHLRGRARDRQS